MVAINPSLSIVIVNIKGLKSPVNVKDGAIKEDIIAFLQDRNVPGEDRKSTRLNSSH